MTEEHLDTIFSDGMKFGDKFRFEISAMLHKEMDSRELTGEEREAFAEGVWEML